MDNIAKVTKVHAVSPILPMELNTIFTGRNLIRMDAVDSTNRLMSGIVDTSLPEGTVVVTGFQSAGKGQGGKYWHSEGGMNLLMTLYWKPVFLTGSSIIKLSDAIAHGLTDMLAAYGIESRIKLPNDIYIGDKKIAGILIENALRGSQVQHSIIGIGLNVNQTVFPEDLPNPVSMKNITGKDYDLSDCMNVLCNYLEKQYFLLRHEL